MSFTEVRFVIKYRVPPNYIYDALTNEEMISKYTQSKCKFEKKVGGSFEMYNGSITGKVVELQENKLLILNWKFSNWKEPTDIKMTIKPKEGNESQITILIKECPNRDANNQTIERKNIIEGFKQQIFEKIQMFIGYPLNKDDESSDED
jgi:activator of HSP90 ATPase